jgi:hypothetical protein
MATRIGRIQRFKSAIRIPIELSAQELEDAIEEMEDLKYSPEVSLVNDLIQKINTQSYERVSPININTNKGETNERIENPVYRRDTPAHAQWPPGRSTLRVHEGVEEGVGEKEKD